MSDRAVARAVVVGGGVIGVTTAAALAMRGVSVTLIERDAALGAGVTARNGGQLSYSYVDALASSAIWRDLPRLLSGRDPAFRIRPKLDGHFAMWTLRFLANCRASRFVDNTRAVLRLALESRAALRRLLARFPDLDFQYTRTGKLHIYESAQKLQRAGDSVRLKNELGCNQRVLTRDELMQLEPALATSHRKIVGAVYSPLDEAGDASLFTKELGAAAARELGVRFVTGTPVTRLIVEKRRVLAVETPAGTLDAEAFVVAAGSGAHMLAKDAGLYIPIIPMKGYSITLPVADGCPVASVTDTQAKIVFCRLGEQLRIAGLAELGRLNDRVEPEQMRWLIQAAQFCLPRAARWHEAVEPWAGMRPMTPDGRPIIGATPLGNLFLNCGHGMLGWTLACGSAELAANAVTQASQPGDFALARFGARP